MQNKTWPARAFAWATPVAVAICLSLLPAPGDSLGAARIEAKERLVGSWRLSLIQDHRRKLDIPKGGATWVFRKDQTGTIRLQRGNRKATMHFKWRVAGNHLFIREAGKPKEDQVCMGFFRERLLLSKSYDDVMLLERLPPGSETPPGKQGPGKSELEP